MPQQFNNGLIPTVGEATDSSLAAGFTDRVAAQSIAAPQPVAPAAPAGPTIGSNEATGEIFVNGATFKVDDAQSAIDSLSGLNSPPVPLPVGFRRVGANEFGSYINNIKDPGLGTLAARNFGIGVNNLGLIGGRLLQFAGAADTGAAVVADQTAELRKNQPFQRAGTDVNSFGGAIDFLVANIAQQGPILAETIATGLVGAGLGATLGVGAKIGGVAARLAGKKAVAKEILAAVAKRKAKKELTGQELLLLSKAARAGGATSGVVGGEIAFGTGDVFGEQVDSGTPNRLTAFGLSIPYAASDLFPELAGAKLLAKGVKGGLLGRTLKGVLTGTVGEGVPEAAQEGLLISQNDQTTIGSPQGVNRLANAFLAGAGAGGVLGGVGAAVRTRPSEAQAAAPAVNTTADNADVLQGAASTASDNGLLATSGLNDPSRQDIRSQSTGLNIAQPDAPVDLVQDPKALAAPPAQTLLPPQGFNSAVPFLAGAPTLPDAVRFAQARNRVIDVSPTDASQIQAAPIAPVAPVPATAAQVGQVVQQNTADTAIADQFRQVQAARDAQAAQADQATAAANAVQEAQFIQAQDAVAASNQLTVPVIRNGVVVDMPIQQALAEADKRIKNLSPAITTAGRKELKVAKTARTDLVSRINTLHPDVLVTGTPTQTSLPGHGTPFAQKLRNRKRVAERRAKPLPRSPKEQGNLFTKKGTPSAAANQTDARQAEADAMAAETRARNTKAGDVLSGKKRKDDAAKATKILLKRNLKDAKAGLAAALRTQRFGKGLPTDRKAALAETIKQRTAEITNIEKNLGIDGSKTNATKKSGAAGLAGQAQTEGATGTGARDNTGPITPPPKKDKGSTPKKDTQQGVRTGPEKQGAVKPTQAPTRVADKAGQTEWDGLRDVVKASFGFELREFSNLRGDKRKAWEGAYKPGMTAADMVEFLQQGIGLSPAEALQHAGFMLKDISIGNISREEYREAIRPILELAFFNKDTNFRIQAAEARELIASEKVNEEHSDDQLAVFKDLIVFNEVKSYNTKGKESAWATYAFDREWIPAIHGALGDQLTGANRSDRINEAVKDVVTGSDKVAATAGTEVATEAVINVLNALQYNRIDVTPTMQRAINTRVSRNTKEADLTVSYEDAPLSEWLNDGKPVWETRDGKLTVKRPDTADASVDTQIKVLDDAQGAAIRNDGGEILAPMSHGAVKLFVKRNMSKFVKAFRPRVMVFKSIAELQRKNARLYAEAIASRPDKADIPVNAAGYSFGKTIIVFSDNIMDKQQLAFVLAHEALGHIGLSVILPRARYNSVMNDLYSSDDMLRLAADAKVELYGLNRQEATEEALADLAAEVETKVIVRVWAHIKNFFNRIGFKFTDDMARYFIFQTRRYTLEGRTGGVSARDIYNNIQRIEVRYAEGRSSTGTSVFGASTLTRGTWTSVGVAADVARITSVLKRFGSKSGLAANVKGMNRLLSKGLEQFQTLSNMAQKSPGLKQLVEVFKQQTEDVRSFQTRLEGMTEFSHRSNLLNRTSKTDSAAGGMPGPTHTETFQASMLLTTAARSKSEALTESTIHSVDQMVSVDENGYTTRNTEAIKEAQGIGAVTREQLAAGLEFQRVDNSGELAFNEDGSPSMETIKPDFKITDRIWKIFTEQRAAVDEAAIIILETKLEGVAGQKAEALRILGSSNKDFTAADEVALKDLADTYARIYNKDAKLEGQGLEYVQANVQKAAVFMREVQRALWNDEKLNDWLGKGKPNLTGNPEGVEQFINDPEFKDIPGILQSLNARNINEASARVIGKTLADLNMFTTQATNAEFFAKSTIMGAYVKFGRDGDLQVSLRVRDPKTGVPIVLHDSLKGLMPFFRTNSQRQADAIAADILEKFKQGDPLVIKNADGETVSAEVYAVVEEAANTSALSEVSNYDEFVQTLVKLNISITPQERERLVKTLAAHHSAARSNLLRTGNPGENPDVVRTNAAHLEMQTHIAGKNKHRYRIAQVMDTDALWFGDDTLLKTFQQRFLDAKKGGNAEKIFITQRALSAYQYMLLHSRGEVSVMQPDGTIKTIKGEGKGNRYRDVAGSLLAFYNQNRDIVDTLDGRLDKISGPLMGVSAFVQLGGSVATALVNLTSIGTHAIPFLSTFNKETGYGGGHGVGAATLAISRAAKDMNLFSKVLNDPVVLEKLVKDAEKNPALLARHGLQSMEELVLLRDETVKGVLTPNLANQLIGVTRAGRSSNNRTKIMQTWMSMFTNTERFNRRVVLIASYRLEKARLESSGATDFTVGSDAFKTLTNLAVTAVNSSQGEYALYNRPAWARSGLGKLLYTYKQFVVITVELMGNLAPKERIMFLAALTFLSGLKGLPFAQDLLDLIDTLAQKFGIPWAGAEVYIAQFANMLVPGMAPSILQGFVNQAFGITASTRLGQGDIIPGTAMFKAGSNTGRELINMFGPVASAVNNIAGAGSTAAQFLAGKVGVRPDVVTAKDVLRTGFGIGAVRSLIAGTVYAADGSITNDRGQTTSRSAGAMTAVTQMLGFYPAIATTQNDVTRMARQARDYATEIKTSFTDAMVKADAAGDTQEKQRILGEVRAWNRDVGQSLFFIRNFGSSSAKSIREARRPTSARFLKSSPIAGRALTRDLMRMYGLSQ